MDIAKSFTFMFEYPEWVRKLTIGTIVTLIGLVLSPILIGLIPLIMVVGYGLLVTRNVLDGQPHPLPEWEDWGDLFVRGLKLTVVLIIWALPAILLVLFAMIPGALSSSISNGHGSNAFSGFAALVLACCSYLAVLWGLLVALFTPAIYVHMARDNDFGAGFAFTQLWEFTRQNLSNVIIAILLTWVASLIASVVAPLGAIAILIGLLITIPLSMLWYILVQSHLYGQVGAAATLAPTSPSVPPTAPQI